MADDVSVLIEEPSVSFLLRSPRTQASTRRRRNVLVSDSSILASADLLLDRQDGTRRYFVETKRGITIHDRPRTKCSGAFIEIEVAIERTMHVAVDDVEPGEASQHVADAFGVLQAIDPLHQSNGMHVRRVVLDNDDRPTV